MTTISLWRMQPKDRRFAQSKQNGFVPIVLAGDYFYSALSLIFLIRTSTPNPKQLRAAQKIQNDLQTAEEMTKKAYAIRDAYERAI